jgi:hypothetical protein
MCSGGIRHHDKIMGWQEALLMAPEDFPQTPPDTVANDRVPEAA